MIANYGYKDGAGDWFLSIDTDKCAGCGEKPCVNSCPEQVLEAITDDYDDEVVAVREAHRKKLRYSCNPCPRMEGKLPCQQVCPADAIVRSW
ncbi:4Fe-4S dicluster domain-containing protein [Desulfotomaculum copahuensis]|uniref:Ferredoxin n=1 Tax=Desulfotomaculum copahuensis TaxID=1838280 RepID=A0A1B7LGP6_9FIRM|nr:4Fe-4S dicluster domain-containing protein [Desulfotomaculum copahuensis]OAT85275.1 ferredoxin [Desulfotomaculum copahuensis]